MPGIIYHLATNENHERLSGIKKLRPYRPYPETLIQFMEKHGRDISDQEYREIFGWVKGDTREERRIKQENPEAVDEYKKRKTRPLTEQEKEEIRTNMKLVREDISNLADRIVKTVWGGSDKNGV